MSIEELSKELPSLLNEPNKKLYSLYKEKYSIVKELMKKMEELKVQDEKYKAYNLNMQFLAVPNKYLEMRKKIMIVGKEMGGGVWCQGEPENWMHTTIHFQEIEKLTNSNPFWRTINELSKSINGENSGTHDDVVWTNIRQISYSSALKEVSSNDAGKIGLADELTDYYLDNMSDLLEKQIEIVKPDVVIFFTGHYYDAHINNNIKNLKYSSIDGFSTRELAKLESSILPKHSYRTYHPGFLNRHTDYKNKILNTIKKEIEK